MTQPQWMTRNDWDSQVRRHSLAIQSRGSAAAVKKQCSTLWEENILDTTTLQGELFTELMAQVELLPCAAAFSRRWAAQAGHNCQQLLLEQTILLVQNNHENNNCWCWGADTCRLPFANLSRACSMGYEGDCIFTYYETHWLEVYHSWRGELESTVARDAALTEEVTLWPLPPTSKAGWGEPFGLDICMWRSRAASQKQKEPAP